MDAWNSIVEAVRSETGQKVLLTSAGAIGGWGLRALEGWWKNLERYQAHVGFQTIGTTYGEQELPHLIVQNVHSQPINITRVRIRNGFGWKMSGYAFDSEDPEYPNMPVLVRPGERQFLTLSETTLNKALDQSRLLKWLWVPRVYICVETMGRGERRFVAEGGLRWSDRRSRYRM